MGIANLLILIGITVFIFNRGGAVAAIVYLLGMLALLVAGALGVPIWAIFIMSMWLAFILPRKPINPEPKI